MATLREFVGLTGKRYTVKETLQDRGTLLGCVYRATDGKNDVVLKYIPQDWEARNKIYDMARDCAHIRLPIDRIPEQRMLVFEYLNDNLLQLVQKDLPIVQVKRILKTALMGIASMHKLRISHNDIKANNILVQTRQTSSGIEIDRVLITDLETALQLAPGVVIQGIQLGNFMWRSPEAHAAGLMENPSDIFAFGIVCIYAVTKTLIFAMRNPNMADDDIVATVLFRQLSYFGDERGFQDLLEYLGKDNPNRDIFEAVEGMFRDLPRNPLSSWDEPSIDEDFKDLVERMTRLDPKKRITADEALKHRWLAGIRSI